MGRVLKDVEKLWPKR